MNKRHGQVALVTLTAMAFALATFGEARAMRVEIRATGAVRMNGNMNPYEKAVFTKISEECLAAKAAKDTKVEVIVDCHGNVIDLNLTGSGLNTDQSKALVDQIRATKFTEAEMVQSTDMEIKLTFDLYEIGGGPVNYTGTSLKVGPGKGGASISGGMIINNGSVTIGSPKPADKAPDASSTETAAEKSVDAKRVK